MQNQVIMPSLLSVVLQLTVNQSRIYPKTKLCTDSQFFRHHVAKKQDAAIDFYRKLKNSWYINSLFGWQQNTQLGLNSRFLLSGSGGKMIINSNQERS
jgi:hypothetical protein